MSLGKRLILPVLILPVLLGVSACSDVSPVVLPTVQPDYQRELRLNQITADALWEGEIVHISPAPKPASELNALNDEPADSEPVDLEPVEPSVQAEPPEPKTFIAVHSAPADQPARAVALMLHGRGRHPLREHPNQQLINRLTQQGVVSLALQMPVLEADADYNQYLPILPDARRRISGGLSWLAEHYPDRRPYVIAHSCGVHMMMDWIDAHGDGDLAGFIGLSMHNFAVGQAAPKPYPIAEMTVPLLDVMAERSSSAVLRRAWLRRADARSAGLLYRRLIVADTDSSYRHAPDQLAAGVVEFIRALEAAPSGDLAESSTDVDRSSGLD